MFSKFDWPVGQPQHHDIRAMPEVSPCKLFPFCLTKADPQLASHERRNTYENMHLGHHRFCRPPANSVPLARSKSGNLDHRYWSSEDREKSNYGFRHDPHRSFHIHPRRLPRKPIENRRCHGIEAQFRRRPPPDPPQNNSGHLLRFACKPITDCIVQPTRQPMVNCSSPHNRRVRLVQSEAVGTCHVSSLLKMSKNHIPYILVRECLQLGASTTLADGRNRQDSSLIPLCQCRLTDQRRWWWTRPGGSI